MNPDDSRLIGFDDTSRRHKRLFNRVRRLRDGRRKKGRHAFGEHRLTEST